MISFVCWRWTPHAGYRSTFGPETVNALQRAVAKHYPHPHRFICVTDRADGIAPSVEVLPDFGDFRDLPHPNGTRGPSCYRRLRLFHPDAAQWFGERFVSLDLDTVVTGDLTPVVDRADDFVIWGDTNPTTFYNGSMVLMTAGARPQVWTDFDPARSPALAREAGQYGSDQGWISYRLGPGERKFTRAEGVYSYRNHIAPKPANGALPKNARIVFFHGSHDPWSPVPQRLGWVRQHWGVAELAAVGL